MMQKNSSNAHVVKLVTVEKFALAITNHLINKLTKTGQKCSVFVVLLIILKFNVLIII